MQLTSMRMQITKANRKIKCLKSRKREEKNGRKEGRKIEKKLIKK